LSPDAAAVLAELDLRGRPSTSRGLAKALKWRHEGASIKQTQPDRYRVERAAMELVRMGLAVETRAARGSRWKVAP